MSQDRPLTPPPATPGATAAAPVAPAAGKGAGDALHISWEEPRGFYLLSLKNALLTLLTLGIYYFWGKVEVRRRLWHAIRVNGEPLEYTGTGKELFLGFIIAVGLLVAGVLAYSLLLVMINADPDNPLWSLPLYLALLWLTGFAVYRARRYRLRRTRWRGIRGTMAGSASDFAGTWTGTTLLAVLSLGWALPWRQVLLYRYLTNDTRIGNAPLHFADEARAGPLYFPFAMMWFATFMVLLLIGGAVTSGIALVMETGTARQTDVWVFGGFGAVLAVVAVLLALRYHAFRLNYLARHTQLHEGHFQLDFRTADLLRLVLGNALILAFSFGLLLPVVQKRLVRHFVQKLSFVGTVDLAAIAQATDKLEKTGEGLAEAFDIDAF